MKFRTILDNDSGKFVTESGSPYLDQYQYDFDKNGEVKSTTLHKNDKPINVYERIQADYAATDINLLMKKFALGDTSAINVKDGIYADVTKMPKTFADLFSRINDCQTYFDQLPVEVKQLFNNSYEEFWSEYGSKDFDAKIDKYNDSLVDHSFEYPDYDVKEESEVKEGE